MNTIKPHHLPGGIHVTKETVRAHLPAIDAKIIAHIEGWAASVPVGTLVPVIKMITCSSACGCPPDGLYITCKGAGHGLPMEIVMDHLFPPDGSPCTIPGVLSVPVQGPRSAVSLGIPKMIKRVA